MAEPAATLEQDIDAELDKAEGIESEGQEIAEPAIQTKPEDEPLQPIETWPDERKEIFERWGKVNLPEELAKQAGLEQPLSGRELQQLILDFHKDFNGGFTKNQQKLAHEREQFQQQLNDYQTFQQVIEPVVPLWQMQGMNWQQGLGQLLGYARALQQDPQGTIMNLAQAYGVDLAKTLEDQPFRDPEVVSLKQKLTQFEQQQQQAQMAQQRAQYEAAQRKIHEFQTATDEGGNPKHPKFEEYFDDMLFHMKRTGQYDLETAYNYVQRFDPEHQSHLEERKKAEEAKKRQAEADKAKAATKTVDTKGKPAGKVERNLDDEIWHQMGGKPE